MTSAVTENERRQTMSDLIERSEVLKQLRLNHKDVVYIDKKECARRIEAIPSARPKAEWIKNIDGDYECSECHVAIRGDGKPIYPFCAWCGADMRGE